MAIHVGMSEFIGVDISLSERFGQVFVWTGRASALTAIRSIPFVVGRSRGFWSWDRCHTAKLGDLSSKLWNLVILFKYDWAQADHLVLHVEVFDYDLLVCIKLLIELRYLKSWALL